MPVIINGTTGISGVDGSAGTPAFQGSDANTGIRFGTDIVSLVTGGSDRLYIDSSGRLGIGTTTPTNYGAGIVNLSVNGSAGSAVDVAYNGTRQGAMLAGNSLLKFDTAGTSIPITFSIDGSEAVRVDTSKRLLVGTSSARGNFFNVTTIGPALQIEAAANNSAPSRFMSITYGNSTAAGPIAILAKHRGTSLGSYTVVSSDDELGRLSFQGADGTEFVEAASILAQVDGTPGANDMPGRLVFSTTADGASSPTERMRIANDGSISSVIPGGSTLYPRFGCRAWVNFNGTGTVAIRASGNVSSITDNGTGDYTVNFTTALADANYCITGTMGDYIPTNTARSVSVSTTTAPSTSAVRIVNIGTGGAEDQARVSVAIFR